MFAGYLGVKDIELLNHHLQMVRDGRDLDQVSEIQVRQDIYDVLPEIYKYIVRPIASEDLAKQLATHDQTYVASMKVRKATLSTISLCEGVMAYLSHEFGGRCKIYEQSPVKTCTLTHKQVQVETYHPQSMKSAHIQAQEIVFCTN
ncbi:MAG: hypothetical protein H6765_00270 [Candidatus Peribacteria bacterium]|nr:MAG: hypothetical protein H6765_00270 [Candidatus Peribacteria bacterium]